MMPWISSFLLDSSEDSLSPDVIKHMNNVEELTALPDDGPYVWSVGGGKGGVGKSFIASSFGSFLAELGNRVLLVDADFGAANLHSFLGVSQEVSSLSSFLKGEEKNINNVICSTSIPSLDLISGANDVLDVADVQGEILNHLMVALRKTDYDCIVIDIGPGTSAKMLDLVLMSNSAVLISTPDPTSIENTYRFLKSLCLRKIKLIINSGEGHDIKQWLHKVLNSPGQGRPKSLVDIFDRMKDIDNSLDITMKSILGDLCLSFIINQARTERDETLPLLMSRACYDYFGLEINPLGHISHEVVIAESILKKKPLMNCLDDDDSFETLRSCFQQLLGNTSCEENKKIVGDDSF